MGRQLTLQEIGEYEMVWRWARHTKERVTDRDLIKTLSTLQEWIDRNMCGETLAERLRYAMLKKGFNGRELADASGVAQSTISNILNGKMPRIDTVQTLAKGLGVSFGWLASGEKR